MTVAVFELAAVVLAAHPQASISQPAMAALMTEGVPLLVSDGALLPSGLMLPISGNVLSARRMIAQAAAGLPLKKRLWAQIVKAKVHVQATTLDGLWNDDAGLRALAQEVRSGDPSNIEAQAAQRCRCARRSRLNAGYWARRMVKGATRCKKRTSTRWGSCDGESSGPTWTTQRGKGTTA